MTTTAVSTPTMPQIPFATTDPVAAMDAFNTDTQNLLEDSFAQFLRSTRGARPISSNAPAPTGLSPRVYGLSPRLPSALPPSASPKIVEGPGSDRQQPALPFLSKDDDIELSQPDDPDQPRDRAPIPKIPTKYTPSRTLPVDVVEDDKMDDIFDNLPRKPVPPPLNMSAPEPRQRNYERNIDCGAMVLNIPPELPPIAKPTAVTAPPGDRSRPVMAAPSPLAPFFKDPSHLAPSRPELQLPNFNTFPPPATIYMDRPSSRRTSPIPPPFPRFGDPSFSTARLPTSSISDADSSVTDRRHPRRPHPSTVDDSSNSIIMPRAFRTTASLPIRQYRKTADPLRCERCDQRFARRSNLFKHLRSVHDERRRFPCTECSTTFKRRDHLKKHIRCVHDKERNYSCDICGTDFAEKFNRDKHRRSIHETKRAFQCPCGAYFQDREKMQNCLRCKQ